MNPRLSWPPRGLSLWTERSGLLHGFLDGAFVHLGCITFSLSQLCRVCLKTAPREQSALHVGGSCSEQVVLVGALALGLDGLGVWGCFV